ncbi:DUF3298 and DUF4163 domain-containing protein [Marilutibacter maris]|uniref:DUF3298 domain-containing protein n=1 Tax=Marilutibacter maris TaxID=1605891 RepID=A0A2U9T8B2_9GAMM|nr:DUF3298 and DUF4163 domain-containing protein [Lysobacter maris]AWV07457.1 hypothetical protein C9I47_1768 [Lysobacter maris]
MILSSLVVLSACDRGQAPAADAPSSQAAGGTPEPGTPEPAPAPEPVELKDVSEVTSDYVVGITYPPSAMKYPGLAAELKRYADDAREDLMQAVAARTEGEAATLYDLSLTFTEVANTPQLFAIAADGSSYTGGAHSSPLLARFVWLPEQQQRLRITDLFPADGDGWAEIASQVRESLHTALSQRLDADELSPGERERMMRDARRMIEDGTGPEAENYSEFEPVVGRDGRIEAIRFVFPPYQVGPYSDGEQVVQLPASALLPYVAEQYRKLFSTR